MQVHVREFTDPGCPFAFSAEPAIWRLRWLYGDALDWETRMVVLSDSGADYEERGFTVEKFSAGLKTLQQRHGMPIDWRLRPRMAGTRPACTAFVAARLYAPDRAPRLLRALRVRAMGGDLLDDQATIHGAARDAGIDPHDLERWLADPAVAAAVSEDIRLARRPSTASLAQVHKLAPTPEGGNRYTCPSFEFTGPDGRRIDSPGFQPVEVYEAAIANLAPDLERREAPESAEQLLAWAGVPLATAEVASVMGVDHDEAQAELARIAHGTPVGADSYWSLADVATSAAA